MSDFCKSDFSTLEHLLMMTQKELHKEMAKLLNDIYPKRTVSTKSFIIAFGDIPIALCAHMDTVFEHPPTEIFWDRTKQVVLGNYGLGADDRAGIYAIVKILEAGYRPTIILTADEELGNLGAQVMVQLIQKPPIELKYIIQLDRRDFNDCVFYDCWNEEFMNYIINFNYNFAYGTFSDISTICPAWGIAGVNLSVGYKDEHSFCERLYTAPLMNTIERVKKMLDDVDNAPTFKYLGVANLNEY